MDPYLEDPALWPGFHRQLVACLCQLIRSAVVGGYDAVVGTRRYTTTEEHQEDYIEIRRTGDGRLVTLVDVVSPANKTTAGGREAYLDKRQEAKAAGASLVEIDLVLQGQPTLDYSRDGLPHWDYAVTIVRLTQPERFEIYTATLQKRLPRFRLPLAPDGPDAVLDLGTAVTSCYAEGDYFARIDYRRDPSVPLGEEERGWLDATLVSEGLRAPTPPHEDIATAAYYIWQEEGCPHGRDTEHWQNALAQLRGTKATDGTTGDPR
jgi:hypothetical protein